MIRITLADETDLGGWRAEARALAMGDVRPDEVEWSVATRAECGSLFAMSTPPPPPAARGGFAVPRDLISTIDCALLHSDPDRFALAYRMVWRSRREPGFHRNPADPDVHRLAALAKSVRRDIHKMHAFVRFRKTGGTGGRERFVAWFEPEHHITLAVAPFFRNRFTGMDWLIVTPEASIAWDGDALKAGPGGTRADVPQDDAVEEEWRAYYASIFNPARVKVQAMKSEMPVKYWRNLPEAALIGGLIADAGRRVDAMVEAQRADEAVASLTIRPQHDAPRPGDFASLDDLYAALRQSDAVPMADFSPVMVPGEGPARARIMLVGEQPGDQEDIAGRPFVGPAGQMLDRAMAEAGIDRAQTFVTNAVKRFKFVARGKRRIHSKPTNDEIDHYRWWLEEERKLVRPDLVVALGATAARALTGQTVTISRTRGAVMPLAGDSALLITIHPSFLLRLPDEQGKAIEYGKFVRDLEIAASFA